MAVSDYAQFAELPDDCVVKIPFDGEVEALTEFFAGDLPEGIDCQRCHGPGRAHVESARNGASPAAVRAAIVNPGRLAPERQIEVCLQCHLESTSRPLPYSLRRYGRGMFSYRPGEALENYILHFDRAPGTGHDDASKPAWNARASHH